MRISFQLKSAAVGLLLMLLMPAIAMAYGNYGQRCGDDNAFVTSLYNSILKREPDSAGYRYWLNALRGELNREQVISRFFTSDEYRGFGRNSRDYARDLYAAVLGRSPDHDGHDYWLGRMNQGMSRAEVLQRFFDSPEYKGIVRGCVGPVKGSYIQRCADDKEFVSSLYNSILGRASDDGGYRHWLNALRGELNREQVISRFFTSNEYKGFGKSNREYVRDLYHGVLGREPDQQGLTYWIRSLDSGKSREQVFQGFIDSPEYRKLKLCR